MHDTALYVVWLNIDIEMPKILLVSRGVCRFYHEEIHRFIIRDCIIEKQLPR